MKNVNIMGSSSIFSGGGSQKKIYIYIYMGNCLKRRLGRFAGGLAKNREGVFEEVDTLIHTVT